MSEEVNRPERADAAPRADKDSAPGEPKFKVKRRRKVSILTIQKIDKVDYKDVALLRRFINDRGKILASRQTGNTASQQRMITKAIHRAREMALMPFVVTDMVDRREHGHRRERPPRDSYSQPAPAAAPAAPESAAKAAPEAATE